MKMNIKFLVFLSFALFLAACGENTVINVNEEAKETGDISFLVINRSGEVLDSVKIYRISDGKSNLTDESGYAVWEKNKIGTQVFTVTKDGYAPMRITVNVQEQGKGNVARVPDVTEEVVMHELGASIQGTMMYLNQSTGNLIAAEGVPVILSFGNANFTSSEITVETDENGEYVFEDLPEGVAVSISVPQTIIENHFYTLTTDITSSIDRANEVENLGISQLSLVAKTINLIKTNLTEIDTATNISLSFSTELKEDSIAGNWVVSNSSSDIVLTSASLKDSKTIVIKPISGKWEKGEFYTVSGIAYNIEGNTTNFNQTFTVGKSASAVPGQVSNLEATLDGSYVELSWKAPSGTVTGYYIYYKTNSMDDYLLFDYTSSTTFSEYESYLKNLVSDTSVKFIVLPYNEAGTATISDAKAISYTFDE